MRVRAEMKYIQIAVLVIATAIYAGLKYLPFSGNASATDDLVTVSRVIDGDTIELSNAGKVRLIGVDTPEVHYSDKLVRDAGKNGKDIKTIQALGRKASAHTKGLCLGRKVRLEFDVEKRDRYGRLLAYVYLEDGTFLNARIIEDGYGSVLTVPPNVKYAELLLKAERRARDSGSGLWNESPDIMSMAGRNKR